MLLKQYRRQDTGGIRGLSEALCQESVKMGQLVKIEHPNISVGGGTVHLYFQKRTAAALKRIADKKRIIINTGFRTLAQQYALKRNLTTLVAPVGRSDHGAGRSVDIENWSELYPLLRAEGFVQPYRSNDAVHWDYPDADLRSNAVKAFQSYWNRHNSDKLTVDGDCGQKTLACLGECPVDGWKEVSKEEIKAAFEEKTYEYDAVRAFQRLYNETSTTGFLKVDGLVGQNTLAAYAKWVDR
jgi:hypothetical protein